MHILCILICIIVVMVECGSVTDLEDSQVGLSICSINVNGFSSENERGIAKRLQLGSWCTSENIDICCGQEWYKFDEESKSKKPKLTNTNFAGYFVHNSNSKTFILYKNNLVFHCLDYNLNLKGIDVTWGILDTGSCFVAIASLYYSPSFNVSFDGLASHIRQIRKDWSDKPLYFSINGDFNARHELWAKKTDNRGYQVLDFVTENHLKVCNTDGFITFRNSKTKETDAIDLTLVANNAVEFVTEWYTNVDLFYQKQHFSDHFCIVIKFDFILSLEPPILKHCWRFNKKNDSLFCQFISKNMEEWWQYFLIFRNDADRIHELTDLFHSANYVEFIMDIELSKHAFGHCSVKRPR